MRNLRKTMEIEAFFISLLFLWCGYYVAREKGRTDLALERDKHRTLAIQALYANGMGKISEEEFDTHDHVAQMQEEHSIDESSKEDLGVYHFVKQKIDELVNLDERALVERGNLLALYLNPPMLEIENEDPEQ